MASCDFIGKCLKSQIQYVTLSYQFGVRTANPPPSFPAAGFTIPAPRSIPPAQACATGRGLAIAT